jgi:Domain of unknown function (DUF892)
MKSMEELFHAQLQDVYFAEKQLLKALPKLAKNSTNEQLAQAFTHHLKETEGQVDRLEKVFELIEKKPRGRTCDAILGIIAEGQEVIEDVMTTRFATPVSWPPARPPNITRSPATAHWPPGPNCSVSTMPWSFSTRLSRRKRRPTSC